MTDQYDPVERLKFLRQIRVRFGDRHVYIHYKGGVYVYLGEAQHTERARERVVIYQHLWPHNDVTWRARPIENFFGTIEGPTPTPRFRKVNFDAL